MNTVAHSFNIQQHRSSLMGLAILMIMLFHNTISFENNADLIWRSFSDLFEIGVDIFLFLSGFGFYYSYTKQIQKANLNHGLSHWGGILLGREKGSLKYYYHIYA